VLPLLSRVSACWGPYSQKLITVYGLQKVFSQALFPKSHHSRYGLQKICLVTGQCGPCSIILISLAVESRDIKRKIFSTILRATIRLLKFFLMLCSFDFRAFDVRPLPGMLRNSWCTVVWIAWTGRYWNLFGSLTLEMSPDSSKRL
jgi:hypothetical protein